MSKKYFYRPYFKIEQGIPQGKIGRLINNQTVNKIKRDRKVALLCY
jgi:hypothetical protein